MIKKATGNQRTMTKLQTDRSADTFGVVLVSTGVLKSEKQAAGMREIQN